MVRAESADVARPWRTGHKAFAMCSAKYAPGGRGQLSSSRLQKLIVFSVIDPSP